MNRLGSFEDEAGLAKFFMGLGQADKTATLVGILKFQRSNYYLSTVREGEYLIDPNSYRAADAPRLRKWLDQSLNKIISITGQILRNNSVHISSAHSSYSDPKIITLN